jgi:hypothetical protein
MKRMVLGLMLWAVIAVAPVSAADPVATDLPGRGAGGSWAEDVPPSPLQMTVAGVVVLYAVGWSVRHEMRRRRNQAEARARRAEVETPVVLGK